MDFWTEFGNVWREIWGFIDTPMTFGSLSFSFGDILVVTALTSLIIGFVSNIIYGDDVRY